MIILHTIGKVKESYIKEATKEYLKRIKKYTNIEYKEEKDYRGLKGYKIALDLTGKKYSSIQFAKKLNDIMIHRKDIHHWRTGGYPPRDPEQMRSASLPL